MSDYNNRELILLRKSVWFAKNKAVGEKEKLNNRLHSISDEYAATMLFNKIDSVEDEINELSALLHKIDGFIEKPS